MADTETITKSTVFSDEKRWNIMAALLGTNTALLLVQTLQQETKPELSREIGLTIVAATIPFQGLYFLLYTFLQEQHFRLDENLRNRFLKALTMCQGIGYMSLIGMTIMWFNTSIYMGSGFLISTTIAIIFIKIVMKDANKVQSSET
ncbi:MAG: hypothetical protein ACPHK2_01795 [Candidatus Poseidoniaceae archaeon]|jgi:hypothetical protein|nr:hypothetical protein [Euryarchaeota archaeon]MBR60018.1 hypothetical protein [Euryarchaeota archaeon]DAC14350.1 MAG TPA: hypothetical protein D7I06_09150 [Candidatus Poseidoniales archaeon]HII63759.1 hypothetical protein [Candidatus Poseidoniaceae archaeon]|tara:strand:+ start:15 stop:455 length:441 start_codon:yes stop_codon:yes gene_type:complete